jgi:glycosyltransferase involved in cell wall biosynthesis
LNSIASQDTGGELDYEILVIDDGSTDATLDVVRRAASESRIPIRYFREDGKGVPFARNRGVSEARGEWIAFFDDDQTCGAEWLRELMLAARETGAAIVGGVRRLRFEEPTPDELGPLTREVLGEKWYGPEVRRSSRYTLACTGNVLIHRAIFDRIGGFDTSMDQGMSDIDFTRRAHEAGVSSWYTPRAAVLHWIPRHRLGEEYLKWTCLRVGMNLSRINHKSWGALRMSLLSLARVVHALTLNLLVALAARLGRRRALLLDCKCYRWMAEGSARMALHLALPRMFPQSVFLARLHFRGERRAFCGS